MPPKVISLVGGEEDFDATIPGILFVYQEGEERPPDIIRLTPPVDKEETKELVKRIETGTPYSALGIVPMDVGPRDSQELEHWWIRTTWYERR